MLAVKIDHCSDVLLHDQVAGGIRRAIADGSLEVGQRLPPARDLASALGINSNTVLRALRALRDEQLLEFRRGRGVTVVGNRSDGELRNLVHELIRTGSRHGYGRPELIELIRET